MSWIVKMIGRLASGCDLSQEEMSTTIDAILSNQASEQEIAVLLGGLRLKGETVPEIAGAAAAMRRHMTPIRTSRTGVLDTCGTGGDRSATFNISTAAALVAAAAGVPVAKHGNRSVTSRSGSADVLTALGVNIEADVSTVEACLEEVGICFCYAPLMHGSMRIVANVRRQMGVPTIFNLLGPLSNPAGAAYQLLGVGPIDRQTQLAEALGLLGVRRALVVRGEDGLDELTLSDATRVIEVNVGQPPQEFTWQPSDFGLETQTLDTLKVEGPEQAAAIIQGILAGQPGAARDIVVLNAAARSGPWATPHLPRLRHNGRRSHRLGAPRDILAAFGRTVTPMSPATLRLIVLVSCAHALVHIYELAFPSVEQLIAAEFDVGTRVTGVLGNCWRLPFGLGALAAGWFVDRLGSKPLLIVYLLGCAATSILAWWAPTLAILFGTMFAMGTFASIYHPAGLAIISHEATPDQRTMALGYHGILGSIGIAAAPFLAALALWTGASWRQYYLLLSLPGILLALLMAWRLTEHHRERVEARRVERASYGLPADVGQWRAFLLLIVVGAITGFIYAALLNFLPRYLDAAHLRPSQIPPETFRNFLAAGVLLVGAIGQYLAGRWARPQRLEFMLTLILWGMAPFLFWMALAQGTERVWAAAGFALIHFMHQPVYNSLVANYVPAARRSLGYGLSNTMTFGVGSFGASFAGYAETDWASYGTLGAMSLTAGLLALGLLRRKRTAGPAQPTPRS